jgi:hypothetical protein
MVKLSSVLAMVFGLLFTQFTFSAADDCPASSGTISAGNDYCIVTSAATATKIRLNFSSGFDSTTLIENDTTAPLATDAVYAGHGLPVDKAATVAAAAAAASKASGNNGTTVGAQRKLSFIKAAEIIADQIVSVEPIIVDAQFTTLACAAGSATLGSASASSFMYSASAPAGAENNTWYPVALYNAISGVDNYPSGGAITNYANNAGAINADSDLFTRYNSLTGTSNCLEISNGWYYGFDTPPTEIYHPSLTSNGSPVVVTYIGFSTVLLHEMLHGLGFSSLTSSAGVKFSSKDDVYSNFLFSAADSASWQGNTLSNSQRANSVTSNTGLLWSGTNVNTQAVGQLTSGFQNNDGDAAFTSGDRVQMYAPNPVEGGSSVSHFNTAVSPNEIMEPQYTAGSLDIGLALYLLKDIGWSINDSSNTPPTITAVDLSTNEDVAKVFDADTWSNDADGDSLTYSITTCPANISCSVSGSSITLTPSANHNGATHTITVVVNDGKGGTANDSFNLNVIAQNDAPVIDNIPNQTVKVGEYKDINLLTYSTDIDGDGLAFSDTACGANLTCSFPNSSTLRVAASGGVGSTVSVIIEADDSNSGTNSDTFNVTITSAVPSTTVEVGGAAHNDGDAFVLPVGSSQINVNNGSGNYSYSLDYNSSDVTSLITSNANGLAIGLPANGEFSGDYTLTITDDTDGDVITITVTRPLRLNWSATSLLNGNAEQTLKIEGGATGTVYSLVQSGSADLIFLNDSNISVTTATAENNAATFNAALVKLNSEIVTSISSMDVTVQSSYDDVIESAVRVYPSSLHSFGVKNTVDEVLANSTAELIGNEALLTELNIETNYSADVNGEFNVLLPNTNALSAGASYEMRVSASGYNSETLALNSDNTNHDLVLTEIANGITLTGSIIVKGSQNLVQDPPTVFIDYTDGSSEAVTVVVTSATQANFSIEIDLNVKSQQLLSISQSDSVTIDLDVSNITQTQNIEVFLLNNVSVVVATVIPDNTPVDTGGAASGGALNWLSIFFLVFLAIFSTQLRSVFGRRISLLFNKLL